MPNYSGQLWGMESGDKSSFWDSNGVLIDGLNSKDKGLLLLVEMNNHHGKQKK